jgi:hypothetical protein
MPSTPDAEDFMRSKPSTIIPTHPACRKCGADMEVGMIAPTVFSQGRGPVTYVCLDCGSVARTVLADTAEALPLGAA